MVSAVTRGAVSPSFVQAVAREYARVKNPGTGAFAKCVRAVKARGGAVSPSGVCAAAGRKKYGAKKFQAMAAAGRKNTGKPGGGPKKKSRMRPVGKRAAGIRRMVARANPVKKAADTYRNFHGRDPEVVIDVVETIHEHATLPGVGKLLKLVIAAIDGETMVTLKNFKGAILCMNEDADKMPQLFIRGGDQSVNVADFGIDPSNVHETEVLGAVTNVVYETRKDHLGESGGAGARHPHDHDFGHLKSVDLNDRRRKTGSRLPMAIYSTRNKLIDFAGGGYDLPEVGIRG